MKVEFLRDGSPDCPLVRLYEFTPAEARQLLTAVARLATGSAEQIHVHELPFVEVVGGSQLTLVRQQTDHGLDCGVGREGLDCGLTTESWDDIAGLIVPFAQDAIGFQWLVRRPGQTSLLLSRSGQW